MSHYVQCRIERYIANIASLDQSKNLKNISPNCLAKKIASSFVDDGKGWVAPPKRINFQKSSKGPLTPAPLLFIFGNFNCIFFKFHAQKVLFQGPNFAVSILGPKMTPPRPPF